uniref:PH domain-containing protein n=1 Tax=Aplanochytrium stocchinoi TaxID=215587 RepID=A0A7S3PMK0_9STRA|eukprot:CAMPEP_0204872342 /NCGR_PEP_ID=MMETSP1348-20121228/37940_1 /ASSEMBLY_ACC=CAM_ASM_000700 /TAXON_ID=215587 /ORGANISM="Aplanochytrium stocchinoi, Strain GSBS06" /LENGTH=547 /DNA_ID=CAMNT_0052027147 /DNA_START=257 /DNA_END=1900 /DNA_ORIENTATION=-
MTSQNRDKWVIEQEGFLYKRGAGYIAADARRTQTAIGIAGKAEKLRYFCLKRKEGSATEPEEAVLLYYSRKPKGKQSPKGKISLKSGFTVSIKHDVHVELETPARTYYLRPNADLHSAEARTTAGQWQQVLEMTINKIKEWEKHAKESGLELRSSFSRKTMEKVREVVKKRTLTRGASRREGSLIEEDLFINRPGRLGNDNGDGTYGSLWSINGLDGYNALISHFGPVQVDLTRMHTHVKNRVQLLAEQVKVMEEYSKNSSEPVVKVQKTTYNALKSVYKDDQDRLELIDGVFKELNVKVLKPLDQLRNDIKYELDNVVDHYTKYTSRLDRVRKAVLLSSQEVKEKESRYKTAQEEMKKLGISAKEETATSSLDLDDDTVSDFSDGDKSAITNDPKRKTAFNKAITSGLNTFKNLVVREKSGMLDSTFDLGDLKEEVLLARQTRKEKEDYFNQLEKKHTASMMSAMNKLEAVERRRLKSQKTYIMLLNDIEMKLFTRLAEISASGGALSKMIEDINPETDMKMTADALLAQARSQKQKNKPRNQLEE